MGCCECEFGKAFNLSQTEYVIHLARNFPAPLLADTGPVYTAIRSTPPDKLTQLSQGLVGGEKDKFYQGLEVGSEKVRTT